MAEGGNGNINLSLSLNTSPATAELQKYFAALNKGAKDAAGAQKPVGVELARLVKSAKQLGITYSKTSKTFKDVKGIALSFQEVQRRVKGLNQELGKTEKAGKRALAGIGAGFKQVLQGIPQGIGLAIGQQILAPINNLGAALKGAANEAVGAFVTLDQAVRQTASISGEGDAAYNKLTKSVTDLAAASKFTTGELGQATTGLARAGFSAQEIAEALPGVSQGAAAAGASMEEMSDVVIAALGGFQIATSETGDVVDILTAAANSANTDVRELGEGLKYVGPVAKNLGLTLADTAAVAGLLANNGIKASQMGTALRMGLSRLGAAAGGTETAMGDLGRGTANQAEVLKRLGVELATANGELVPFPELLNRLREGFGKLNSIEGQQASRILFGQESATAFISLLNTSSSEVEKFFDVTNNASGTAAETAQNNLKGLAGSLDLLASAQNALFTDLGSALGTFIKPLVDGLTGLINAFNGLPEPVKDGVFAITALATAVGAVTVGFVALKAVAATAIFQQMIAGAAAAVTSLTALQASLATGIAGAAAKAATILQGLATAALAPVTLGTAAATKATVTYASAQATVAAASGTATAGAAANATATTAAGTAAGSASGGFGTLAASLGVVTLALAAFAAAGVAVFAVFDTFNQILGDARGYARELDEGTSELTDGFKELGTELDTANQALLDTQWEQSVQRVGALQAGLDKLRGAVGLQTAENAKLNETTIQVAEALDRRSDAQLEAIKQIEAERDALKQLTPGTEEHKAAVESLVAKEELLAKSVADTSAMLEKVKQDLGLAGKEVKDMTEAEKRLNSMLESGANLMDSFAESTDGAADSTAKLKKELADLTKADAAANAATEKQIKSADRLSNKYEETAAQIAAQRKEIQSLTVGSDEHREAVEELAKAEGEFRSQIESSKSAIEGLIEKHELAGKSTFDLTDAERELLSTLEDGLDTLDDFSRGLEDNAVTAESAAASIKEYEKAQKEAMEAQQKSVDEATEKFENDMANMEQAFDNAVSKMEQEVELNIGVKEGEIEAVEEFGAATVAALEGKINALNQADTAAQRAAEGEIAAIESALTAFEDAENRKITAANRKADQAIAAAERAANAEISTARTASNEVQNGIRGEIAANAEAGRAAQRSIQNRLNSQLSAIDAAEDAAVTAAEAELVQIDQLEIAESARFDAMRTSAQNAHDAVMGNLDDQSRRLDDLRIQAGGVFDEQIAKLREMSPAEKKLHQLRISQLKEEASQGGEDGLRAQAQLDRMNREEEISKLQEQKAAALAAIKKREEELEVARQNQRIAFEGTMLGIADLQASKQEELGLRRAAIETALDEQQQAFERRRKEAQDAAVKAANQAAADTLSREQELNANLVTEEEALAAEEERIASELAKEKLDIEKQLNKDVADLEENIVTAKGETQEAIDKILEARFKAEEKLVKDTAALEKDIVTAKEETKNQVERINGEIYGLEQGLVADKAALEAEFQQYKYDLLTAYNRAVGESHTAILKDGDTTWKNYATNAINNLRSLEVKLNQLAKKKKEIDGGGGGGEVTVRNADGEVIMTNRFTGGPVSGGKNYTVNEFGQESFLSSAGELSMINAPAWGNWRPKTAGTVLNADITRNLGLPSRGSVDLSGSPMVSGNAAGLSARAQSNNMAQVVQGLANAISGDAITNNVTIQAQNTTKAASDMLVELTRVRNRRLR